MNEAKGIQRWSNSYLTKVIRAANKDQATNYYNQGIAYMKKNCMLDEVIAFNTQSYIRAKEALGIQFAWPKNIEGYTAPVTGPNGDFSYWRGAVHE